MIVRTYTGRTVQEALTKVRTDLGDAALIIETRPWKEPGLFGGRAGFEVVAASDDPPVRETPMTSSAPAIQAQALKRPRPIAPTAQAPSAVAPDLAQELLAIRRELARLAAGTAQPIRALDQALRDHLDAVELPTELAAELDDAISRAGDRLGANQQPAFAARVLARALPGCDPVAWDDCRRLLVVGPTGVGKTTTIAKLAGELVLRRNRRVALATIDTYRVGAQDQLKAYADLLDIPCAVAGTPAELAKALQQFESYDHVLVDTSGRSPADEARVHELKGFCRAAPGLQVALALAAPAGRAEFAAVVERFSVLPIEHAIVTKLDECAAPGRLYGCLRRHRLPVRWVTTGQEVPADIAPASAERFAQLVTGHAATAQPATEEALA